MSNNPEVNYLIYRVNHQTTEGIKEFLCLDLRYGVDEETEMRLKRSQMMYGFFEGKAVWYAVDSDVLESWLHGLMLEARFQVSRK